MGVDDGGFEVTGGDRSRRGARLAVVVLAVVAFAAVARVAGSGVEDELVIAAETAVATPSAAPQPVMPTTATGPVQMGGAWQVMPQDPAVTPRTRHSATWTGSEVVIYGGQPDPGPATGAAFDPAAQSWRLISPSPVGSRAGHTAVWTGEELIIFEGAPVGQVAAASAQDIDGAAYDPRTDSWRPIADAPINPRAGHVAVWTGTEMVVFGGSRVFERNASAALYDPAMDTWRSSTPSPLDRAFGLTAAVWTGEEVLIWNGTGEQDMAAYDPAEDSWRLLPGSPVAMRSVSAVWTGTEMLLLGALEDRTLQAGGAAFDPSQGRWTVLPPSPQRLAATAAAVWTGDAALVVGGPRDDVGAAWVPAENRWRLLPDSPQPAISGHSATWADDVLLVWGGQGDERPLGTGVMYRPQG